MTTLRPRRSALYMPAANARAIEKARELDCDVVILDLEDAVAPDAKEIARRQATEAVAAGGFGRREVVIRINGLGTPWGGDDLAAAVKARPHAILVPKVSSADEVRAFGDAAGGDVPMWAMIETCRSLLRLESIAAAAHEGALTAWVVGTNDLAKEIRCRLDGERRALLAALSLTVTAARAYGLDVLDGVYNELDDDAGLEAQCAQGVELGFDGKTLIHPRQIAIANRAFAPSPEDISWSRTIVQAFNAPEHAGRGVLRVEGRMVERLHLEQAQRVLAVAETIGA